MPRPIRYGINYKIWHIESAFFYWTSICYNFIDAIYLRYIKMTQIYVERSIIVRTDIHTNNLLKNIDVFP